MRGDDLDDLASRLVASGWASPPTADPMHDPAQRSMADKLLAVPPTVAHGEGPEHEWHWRSAPGRRREWVITTAGVEVWRGFDLDSLRGRGRLLKARGVNLRRGIDEVKA